MTPTNKSTAQLIQRNVMKAHNIFAHAGEAKTRATARKLDWVLTKKMGPCTHCGAVKAKIKLVQKLTGSPATHRGHFYALDISHVKKLSIGDMIYWLRVEDLFTKMKWSYFFRDKNETSKKIIGLICHLKATKNIKVKTI